MDVIKRRGENGRSCKKGKDRTPLECEAPLGRSGRTSVETCWKGVNVLDVYKKEESIPKMR